MKNQMELTITICVGSSIVSSSFQVEVFPRSIDSWPLANCFISYSIACNCWLGVSILPHLPMVHDADWHFVSTGHELSLFFANFEVCLWLFPLHFHSAFFFCIDHHSVRFCHTRKYSHPVCVISLCVSSLYTDWHAEMGNRITWRVLCSSLCISLYPLHVSPPSRFFCPIMVGHVKWKLTVASLSLAGLNKIFLPLRNSNIKLCEHLKHLYLVRIIFTRTPFCVIYQFVLCIFPPVIHVFDL